MTKLPWYKSNTLRALIVAAAAQLLALSGVSDAAAGDQAAGMTDAILMLIEMGALIFAGFARVRQPGPRAISEAAVRKSQEIK